MKVSYKTLTGSTSTAEVDEYYDVDSVFGMDESTEEVVRVYWSDRTDEWIEVPW